MNSWEEGLGIPMLYYDFNKIGGAPLATAARNSATGLLLGVYWDSTRNFLGNDAFLASWEVVGSSRKS